MSRRLAGAAAAVALAVVVAACGGDDDSNALDRAATTSSTTTSSSTTSSSTTSATTAPEPVSEGLGGELPPVSALALEPLYGEQLAQLGLRLTERGGLIDRAPGRYEQSSSGRHLALYVEPIGEYTIDQYIEGIRTVGALFGDVFDRWPGLESFDVCQEPVAAVDGSDEPPPITQIDISRAQADAIDWQTVTVVDLVRASFADPPGLTLRVSATVADHPSYQAIVDQATA